MARMNSLFSTIIRSCSHLRSMKRLYVSDAWPRPGENAGVHCSYALVGFLNIERCAVGVCCFKKKAVGLGVTFLTPIIDSAELIIWRKPSMSFRLRVTGSTSRDMDSGRFSEATFGVVVDVFAQLSTFWTSIVASMMTCLTMFFMSMGVGVCCIFGEDS